MPAAQAPKTAAAHGAPPLDYGTGVRKVPPVGWSTPPRRIPGTCATLASYSTFAASRGTDTAPRVPIPGRAAVRKMPLCSGWRGRGDAPQPPCRRGEEGEGAPPVKAHP
jgi:hypothetical protein